MQGDGGWLVGQTGPGDDVLFDGELDLACLVPLDKGLEDIAHQVVESHAFLLCDLLELLVK